MRTTVNIADDVLDEVKRYAESRSLAIGRALTELVRRGLDAPVKTRVVNGLVVFDLPANTPAVTSEDVRRLETED